MATSSLLFGLGAPLLLSGLTLLLCCWTVAQVVYCRYFHPLSVFPGPFLASFTNLWKSYQVLLGKYEDTLLKLHRKHGKLVRIGPNHLDVSDADSVKNIFGAGRTYPKSTFYDAFTALRPNLFGTRDEQVHSTRRKAVSNSFSAQSVASMEVHMDRCMEKLIRRLDSAAENGEAIDIKLWIAFFVMDVLGELAFSRPFGVLDSGDEYQMPPVREHVLLATTSGQTPWVVPYVNSMVPHVPVPSLQRMVRGRKDLRQMAIDSVNDRLRSDSTRIDLLGRLLDELKSGVDSKGRALDVVDVQTEAFGFIVAGSHTTAASTTLLLWHLLRNDEAFAKLRDEIDSVPRPSSPSYPYSSVKTLTYFQAVVDEAFRINPVFVMPLMRVVPDGGRQIAGSYIPGGTDISICNHALHHDDSVFGPDLERFLPERWLQPGYDKHAYLMPFGGGHRACVGRNIASQEIYKIVASLLARYDISLALGSASDGMQRMPQTKSFGVADLDERFMVELKLRTPIIV
ncbi:cytochrome P450 [Lineolata rhizophorae]|uniref:Cytochrome P450 n=1 Tax=Lineolata rhizophorae TaxID=578093 RepID=A0A6A6P8J3_9PEZI|nr:cytochrome P450 [Lineolata rhizophorae]